MVAITIEPIGTLENPVTWSELSKVELQPQRQHPEEDMKRYLIAASSVPRVVVPALAKVAGKVEVKK